MPLDVASKLLALAFSGALVAGATLDANGDDGVRTVTRPTRQIERVLIDGEVRTRVVNGFETVQIVEPIRTAQAQQVPQHSRGQVPSVGGLQSWLSRPVSAEELHSADVSERTTAAIAYSVQSLNGINTALQDVRRRMR